MTSLAENRVNGDCLWKRKVNEDDKIKNYKKIQRILYKKLNSIRGGEPLHVGVHEHDPEHHIPYLLNLLVELIFVCYIVLDVRVTIKLGLGLGCAIEQHARRLVYR